MKTRNIIIILLIGVTLYLLGRLLKFLYLLGANLTLELGSLIIAFGGLLLLIKLLKHPGLKDFMDR